MLIAHIYFLFISSTRHAFEIRKVHAQHEISTSQASLYRSNSPDYRFPYIFASSSGTVVLYEVKGALCILHGTCKMPMGIEFTIALNLNISIKTALGRVGSRPSFWGELNERC